MKKRLIKVFTRDFSLLTSEWWRDILREKFKSIFGVYYTDAPATSDGQSVTYYYLSEDLENIKNAVLDKIKRNPNYYIRESVKYRKLMDETRDGLKKLKCKNEIDKEAINLLRKYLDYLYPMIRICNFIPAFWAVKLKKLIGQQKAEKIIKLALEDRLYSEGVFETIDLTLRTLIRNKLAKLNKPVSWSKFINNKELEILLLDKTVDWPTITRRIKGYSYCRGKLYSSKDYLNIFSKYGYYYREDKIIASQDEIEGQVASKGGIIKGKVRLIFALEQVPDLKRGEILVTPMTVPDFMPAIRKAAAVITDEGGITCHAAIVSRELGIPCVIGTKIATKVLKDGDLVEVDANKGIIRKL